MRPPSWARRLALTQVAIVLVFVAAVATTALLVGPTMFTRHMQEAGHDQPGVLDHAQQAFHDAGLMALAVGLGVASLVAVVTAWTLHRSLARGLDALVEGSARVARGDYDQPVRLPSAGPELDQVAAEFNHMAARIASTEQTRRRMLTDLGHELRTPLAALQATLEAVQDGIVEIGPATLPQLRTQVERLSRLANEISEVSRAEEGRLGLDVREHDLDALVAESVSLHQDSCDRAGVRLLVELASGGRVRVDAERIGQVLDNLLRNALQHTGADDTIAVGTRREGSRLLVQVEDTGAGLSAEQLPLVFERFYHDGSTRTREVDGGTGVGLTISRAIAQAHGGRLHAASEGLGRGACFTLELPASAS